MAQDPERHKIYMREWTKRNRHRHQAYVNASRSKRAALMRDLKAKPCADCAGMFPVECMDFDHVRGTKIANVSNMLVHASRERTLIEIDKCEVVCANCHRIRTRKRRSANAGG